MSILPLGIGCGTLIGHTLTVYLSYRSVAYSMIAMSLIYVFGFAYFWDTPKQLCAPINKQKVFKRSKH